MSSTPKSRPAARERDSRRYLIATILGAATWGLFLARTQWLIGVQPDATPQQSIDMRVVVMPPVSPQTSETAQVQVRHEEARAVDREPRLPRRAQPSRSAPAHTVSPERSAQQPVVKRDTLPPPTQAHSDAPLPASVPQPSGDEARPRALSGTGNKEARLLSQPLPELPDDLREQGYQVVAVARFSIHADGAFDVDLLKPTQNPRLNQILLATLRQWRFIPAMKDGRPVESHQDVRVHFNVN